ncbi:MAG: hypothetical protein WD826_12790 [Actinomycetota bacterium]
MRIAIHLEGVLDRDEIVASYGPSGHEIVSLDDQPDMVITADASITDGDVRCLKAEVDAVAPNARTVLVIRNLGDAPLAPTMDAYLDVEMRDGRDVWVDYVGASG